MTSIRSTLARSKNSMRWLTTACLLLLPACSAVTTAHDYCQIAKPIYLQKGEAAKLSDSTAREILTNNETYSKVCGKP